MLKGGHCAGLADPGPVAAALWTDAELQSSVCLDAVVTVVDARNIQRQLALHPSEGAVNEAQQQIAYADVVLLNKVERSPLHSCAAPDAAAGVCTSDRAVGCLFNLCAAQLCTPRPFEQLHALGQAGHSACEGSNTVLLSSSCACRWTWCLMPRPRSSCTRSSPA